MKASDDLFKLIRSMSPREKSYFKRYAGIYSNSEDRNYLRLFRAMEKQKDYDENKLKEDLKGDRVLNHLSYEKGYLYKLLLKSLAAFHSSETLCALKNRSELLLSRGLEQAGNKLLEKALRKARKQEHFSHWLELIQLKIDSITQNGLDNQSEKIEELMLERLDVMRKMANYDSYVHLRFVVFDLQAKGGLLKVPDQNKEYLYLVNHPLLQHASSALSLKARERFYYVKGITHFIGRKFKSWHQGYQEYIKFVESNIDLFDGQILLTLYGNYLLACLKILDKSGFNETLDKMDTLTNKFPGEASKNFCLRYGRMLEFCSIAGNLNRGEEILNETLQLYSKFEEGMIDQNKTFLYLSIIRTLIELGHCSEALDWISRFDKLDGIPISNSLVANIKVMEILCHYEMGSKRLVESHVRNLIRMLKKQNSRDYLLTELLSALGRLSGAASDQYSRNILLQLRDALNAMASDPEHNLSLQYFHYTKWVEGHLNNQPLRAVISESPAQLYTA